MANYRISKNLTGGIRTLPSGAPADFMETHIEQAIEVEHHTFYIPIVAVRVLKHPLDGELGFLEFLHPDFREIHDNDVDLHLLVGEARDLLSKSFLSLDISNDEEED